MLQDDGGMNPSFQDRLLGSMRKEKFSKDAIAKAARSAGDASDLPQAKVFRDVDVITVDSSDEEYQDVVVVKGEDRLDRSLRKNEDVSGTSGRTTDKPSERMKPNEKIVSSKDVEVEAHSTDQENSLKRDGTILPSIATTGPVEGKASERQRGSFSNRSLVQRNQSTKEKRLKNKEIDKKIIEYGYRLLLDTMQAMNEQEEPIVLEGQPN